MSTVIISDLDNCDLDEIYSNLDAAYIAALRAIRDTPHLSKGDALDMSILLSERLGRCASVHSVVRLTRQCNAVVRRYKRKG